MKQKFSSREELHEFFLSELNKIVGVNARVVNKYGSFVYDIYPVEYNKCLWEPTLRKLFTFLSNNKFSYYIDFECGKLRAYTNSNKQKVLGRL